MPLVHIPTPLQSYTAGRTPVEVGGSDLAGVLAALEIAYPGFRFRILDEQERVRTHIKLFVGGRQAHDLATPVPTGTAVHVICALSGG